MKVFVSYKWEDSGHNQWVERLGRDLRARGISALLDRWEVRYGESFTEYMTRSIHECDAILFIITPEFLAAAEAPSASGGAVKFELQLALARKLAGEHVRVIGLLRQGARTAQQLRDLRYADFRDDTSYPDALERLVDDLLGRTDRPAVNSRGASDLQFFEWRSVGDELESPSLSGEFLPGARDLVVWKQSMDGPSSAIGLYIERRGEYKFRSFDVVEYATRVRAAAERQYLITQEREGVYVVDGHTHATTAFLPIAKIGDPIIRSESAHPHLPLVAVGTDYGRVLVWNWREDRIIFSRHHFPAGEVNWISGLTFAPDDILLLCVDNVLSCLRGTTGEMLWARTLGPPEEMSALAASFASNLLAAGSVMDTQVYALKPEPTLLYRIRNSGPLVQELRFSDDGQLVSVVDGGLAGAGVAIADARTGSSIRRFGEVWPPGGSGKWSHFFSFSRWVSFSDDNQLVAIGEGGRVGVYHRPTASAQ